MAYMWSVLVEQSLSMYIEQRPEFMSLASVLHSFIIPAYNVMGNPKGNWLNLLFLPIEI
jgi:hypothetical protein